jgi:hypothetical protein
MNGKGMLTVAALLGSIAKGTSAAGLDFAGGIEHFRWREFGDGGAQLLEESGPRGFFGVDLRQPLGRGSANFLDAGGRVYLGVVDYDGQACNILTGTCVPLDSETWYAGVRAEAALRHSFLAAPGLEVFAGAGVDTWSREIENTATAAGGSEGWTVLFVTTGAGYRAATGLRADAGLKYPFYALNDTDIGATLNPRGRVSAFARLSTTLGSAPQARWRLGAYYDSYRFAESDHEIVASIIGLLEVWQPQSEQDVIGLEVARSWR